MNMSRRNVNALVNSLAAQRKSRLAADAAVIAEIEAVETAAETPAAVETAANVVIETTTPAPVTFASFAAYCRANNLNPKTQRAKLRREIAASRLDKSTVFNNDAKRYSPDALAHIAAK